jgi:hypothetical protein
MVAPDGVIVWYVRCSCFGKPSLRVHFGGVEEGSVPISPVPRSFVGVACTLCEVDVTLCPLDCLQCVVGGVPSLRWVRSRVASRPSRFAAAAHTVWL